MCILEMHELLNFDTYPKNVPSKHLKAGDNRLASETPFEWRFAGRPMVALNCMLAG